MRTHLCLSFVLAMLLSVDHFAYDGRYSRDTVQRIKLESQGIKVAMGDAARRLFY